MGEMSVIVDILKAIEDNQVTESVWSSINNFLKSTLLPEQKYGNDRPATENDFQPYKEHIGSDLNLVVDILNNINLSKEKYGKNFEINRDFVIWSIIVCGEHAYDNLWTTAESRRLSSSCLTTLCKIYKCASCSELLTGCQEKTFYQETLLVMRPRLLKNTWRLFPGAITSFKWQLLEIKRPHLLDYIFMVFPTVLIILDDHVIERKLVGLSCLSHIIENVTRTDLNQHGYNEVIYKALDPLLLQNDANQFEHTIVCLTKLLSKTEHGYTRSSKHGMWDRFDDTIQTLLQKMECEDRLPLRKTFARTLGPFLDAMGPPVIRWSKPLLSVLEDYMHSSSYDTRRNALLAMQIYLKHSSARTASNGDQIAFILLKTLYDVSTEVQDKKLEKVAKPESADLQEQLTLIKNCLECVAEEAPQEMASVLSQVKEINYNSTMNDLLNKIVISMS